MEELFSGLDDAVFTEARCRDNYSKLVSYNAKICEKSWFWSAETLTDDCSHEERIQIYKYRGDDAFHNKNYEEAFEIYTQLLDIVRISIIPLRRDIEESRCRCLLALENPVDALHVALHLHRGSQNVDQKTNTLILILKCYQQMKQYSACYLCLGRLLCLHPLNPDFWIQLSEVVIKPECSLSTEISHTSHDEQAVERKPSSMCFLFNRSFICKTCLIENCTKCSVYGKLAKTDGKKTLPKECCSTCSTQQMEPVVYLDSDTDDKDKGCTNIIQYQRANNHSNDISQSLSDIKLQDCTVRTSSSLPSPESSHVNTEDKLLVQTKLSCACLLRARYLLRNIEANCVSFVKEKYKISIDKVDKKLLKFNLSYSESHFLEKMICHDSSLTSSSPNIDNSSEIVDASDKAVKSWLTENWFSYIKGTTS